MSRPTASDTELLNIALKALLPPGQVAELRAPNAEVGRGYTATLSGYYDDPAKLVADAAAVTAPGVYFTMNPVDPRLLARRSNRLKQVKDKEPSTADKDITGRRLLFVEVDPARPTGICATGAEKAEAAVVADAVFTHLKECGWPDPVVIDSGNGGYLLYLIDLPKEDGGLVANCLKALAARFDTAAAHIDTGVHNPSRIIRLPGTWNRKGDSTADRPHRLCRVVSVPGDLREVSRRLLEALAATAPPEADKAKLAGANAGHANGTTEFRHRLLVEPYLAHFGVGVLSTNTGTDGQKRWRITCPFNPDHSGTDAFMWQYPNGAVGFHCSHSSCAGNKWPAFKETVGKPLPDHYDPPMAQGNFSANARSTGGTSRNHQHQNAGPSANGKGHTNGKAAPSNRWTPTLIRADQVQMRAIRWHWHGRIPAGRITLLSGRPGASKSVVTCFIAAATTTGAFWPANEGRARPGGVIFLAAEDDPADTICPRLTAAGADLSKVVLLDGKQAPDPDDKEKVLKLSVTLQDIDQIAAALDHTPDCKLIVVDPVGSYMGGRVDSHRDAEVRSVLAPLAQLARDKDVAVLMVAHTNKAANQFADDSVLGSRAFVGIARSVLHFTTDKEDKERKLLLPGKNNLARELPGLAYRVETDESVIGHPPKIVWEDEPVHGATADDYLGGGLPGAQRGEGRRGRPKEDRTEEMDFLEELLTGKENGVARSEIETAAKESRLSWSAVRKAKAELGVVHKKQKGGVVGEVQGQFYWGVGDDWEPPELVRNEPAQGDDPPGHPNFEQVREEPQKEAVILELARAGEFRASSTVDSDSEQVRRELVGNGGQPSNLLEIRDTEQIRDSQGEKPVFTELARNSGVLEATPKKTRRKKQPVPVKPTGNPATDEIAFNNLLARAGWTWADVVKWVDASDGYVKSDGDFNNLTGAQIHKLVDHLDTLMAAKEGNR